MEQINLKLELAKNNAFLMHEVFNDLEEILSNKLADLDSDHLQLNELKFLWDKCGHADYAVALEACQSVVNLTINGHLSISESVASLLSCVSTARHFGILTDSITELLVRGKSCPASRHHPFITLVEMEPKTWPHIMQQMSLLMSCGSFSQQILKQFQTFVIYTLCHGSPEVRSCIMNLLVGKLNNARNQLIIDWLMESLLWHQNIEENQCFMYLTSIQQMCEYAIADRDEELGRITAILLVSAMQICHNRFGFGINQSIRLVRELNSSFTLWLEPIIIILSQFLLQCHANCFEPILDLCQHFLSKHCNAYVWSMLQIAVLSIFSYSPKLETKVVLIVETFPNQICRSKSDAASNKYYHHLTRSEVAIKVALATAEIADHLSENVDQLCAFHQEEIPDAIFLLKCAVFWRHNQLSALQGAIQHVSSTKKFANPLLTMLLKKLTLPSNGKIKLAILYSLPKVAVDKSCVPRVLQIIEALSTSPSLQPVRIKVLAELWQIEDRVYRYLEKLIFSENLLSDEFMMAKASVIETVCSLKGEKYGPDLLAAISGLLNSSLVQAGPNSGTIAALALNSLVSLCKAEVVDLKSVWDILAPKLNQDHRPLVVTGICNLLALSPLLRNDTEEYDLFLKQAISVLFRTSLKSDRPDVAETALKSLSRFNKEDFHLAQMPNACKENLKIPSKYLSANAEAGEAIKAEDVMDHVPGVCWVKLMDCYGAEVLDKGFYSLLLHLVKEEIQSMPIWIYRKAAAETTKKNEPTSYNNTLKEDSVLAALMHYMLRICETSAGNCLRMSIALKVLAGPFERPLPPFDWTVLDPIVEQYNLREEFLRIVFQQVPHSYSAQVIAEQVLTSQPLHVSWSKVALSYLGPISKGVRSKIVEDFICQFINENQSDCSSILEHLHCALVKDEIQADVKHRISTCLMSLLPILPEDAATIQQFSHCFRLLRLTDFPTKASPDTASKYMKILCTASIESESTLALNYLQKALQASFYLPCLNGKVLELVHKCVAMHCKSTPAFLQQFISYIQMVAMKELQEESTNFGCLMDVFCLVISSLSDSLCFRQRPDHKCLRLQEAWNHFPLGLSLLLTKPAWVTIKKCMLDWILVMIENQNVSTEQKQMLFNALTSIDTINKEIFSKIVKLI